MSDTHPSANAPAPEATTGRCAFCGAFTALQLGARWICEACYQERGSCCIEAPETQG